MLPVQYHDGFDIKVQGSTVQSTVFGLYSHITKIPDTILIDFLRSLVVNGHDM